MKIEEDEDVLGNDCLMLVPETDFEKTMLTNMYSVGNEYKAFIKTGATASEIVGLKITTVNVE